MVPPVASPALLPTRRASDHPTPPEAVRTDLALEALLADYFGEGG